MAVVQRHGKSAKIWGRTTDPEMIQTMETMMETTTMRARTNTMMRTMNTQIGTITRVNECTWALFRG